MKGQMAAWLEARGWYRDALSAVDCPPCGSTSDRRDGTGYCERGANWRKPGRGPLCSHHAVQRQEYDNAHDRYPWKGHR